MKNLVSSAPRTFTAPPRRLLQRRCACGGTCSACRADPVRRRGTADSPHSHMSAWRAGSIDMDTDINAWIGLSVGQVLAQCGTAYEEVVLVDEPPGKLRAVEFVCHKAAPPRKLRLQIAYDPSLFSDARAWARSLVEARPVTGVVDQD